MKSNGGQNWLILLIVICAFQLIMIQNNFTNCPFRWSLRHDNCSFVSVWSYWTSTQASIIIQLNFNAHFAKWESSFTRVGAHPTNDPISNTQTVNVSFVTPYHHQKKDCSWWYKQYWISTYILLVSPFIYQCNYRAAKKFCLNPLFTALFTAFSFSNWHYFYIPWLPINLSKRKSLFVSQSLSLVLLRIWFILGARVRLFSAENCQGIGGMSHKSPRSEWVKQVYYLDGIWVNS